MARNIEIFENREKQTLNNKTNKKDAEKRFEKKQKEKYIKINAERKKEDELEKPKNLNRLNKKLEEQKAQEEFAARRGSIEKLQKIEIGIKGKKYTFKFDTFTLDGEPKLGHEIQNNFKKGHVTIESGRVKARIKLEKEKAAQKMTIDVPIKKLLSGDAATYIKTTCENIFGGALEWYNKQKENKPVKGKEKEKFKKEKQEVKDKIKQTSGVVAIFEMEGLTLIIIRPKQNKQIILSTITGPVWGVEEDDNRQEIKHENIIEYLSSSIGT
jgi:hypothetical protein